MRLDRPSLGSEPTPTCPPPPTLVQARKPNSLPRTRLVQGPGPKAKLPPRAGPGKPNSLPLVQGPGPKAQLPPPSRGWTQTPSPEPGLDPNSLPRAGPGPELPPPSRAWTRTPSPEPGLDPNALPQHIESL